MGGLSVDPGSGKTGFPLHQDPVELSLTGGVVQLQLVLRKARRDEDLVGCKG